MKDLDELAEVMLAIFVVLLRGISECRLVLPTRCRRPGLCASCALGRRRDRVCRSARGATSCGLAALLLLGLTRSDRRHFRAVELCPPCRFWIQPGLVDAHRRLVAWPPEMSVWPGVGHGALGKFDPGPDVHVDHDADDLEDLLHAEVLGERVVEALEGRVPVGVGGTG
jgi:hypothetical protein